MCVSMANMAMSANTWTAAGTAITTMSQLADSSMRARMSRDDAVAVQAASQTKAKRIRAAGERAVGQTRAGAVAAGVALDSASALEAERATVQAVEQDALSAILSGNNEASALRASARAYRVAGITNAAGTLVGGLGRWKSPMTDQASPAWRVDDGSYDRMEMARLTRGRG